MARYDERGPGGKFATWWKAYATFGALLLLWFFVVMGGAGFGK